MSTYTLISSQVLGSSAASVTFSSIPSTYKDLILKTSIRDDLSGTLSGLMTVQFSGDSATNYSGTLVDSNAGNATSARRSNDASVRLSYFGINSTGSTSNTFSSAELYLPNYNSTTSKPLQSDIVVEQNDSTNYVVEARAALWRNTSAISSILCSLTTGNFVAGSSFYLYGV